MRLWISSSSAETCLISLNRMHVFISCFWRTRVEVPFYRCPIDTDVLWFEKSWRFVHTCCWSSTKVVNIVESDTVPRSSDVGPTEHAVCRIYLCKFLPWNFHFKWLWWSTSFAEEWIVGIFGSKVSNIFWSQVDKKLKLPPLDVLGTFAVHKVTLFSRFSLPFWIEKQQQSYFSGIRSILPGFVLCGRQWNPTKFSILSGVNKRKGTPRGR